MTDDTDQIELQEQQAELPTELQPEYAAEEAES
jgi:hypothetical protein